MQLTAEQREMLRTQMGVMLSAKMDDNYDGVCGRIQRAPEGEPVVLTLKLSACKLNGGVEVAVDSSNVLKDSEKHDTIKARVELSQMVMEV